MIDLSKIEIINKVIEAYFAKNPSIEIIPAKELMPNFIEAGLFLKDNKNGKPIREILRELDKSDQRQLIPFLHAEQKGIDTYWYFIPANAPIPTTPYKQDQAQSKKEIAKLSKLQSDEKYVIDLCDSVLELKAERQKRFDFLLGDFHKDGVTRTKLPVNAYYEELKLVIEYKESQQVGSIENEDGVEFKTVSGLSRIEQRKIYDQRRATGLPKHGMKLIEIPYSVFDCDSNHKIIRNAESDLLKIQEILKEEKMNWELNKASELASETTEDQE